MSDLEIHRDICSSDTATRSTVFACVRASSLGLAVSDLSWVYCWAAIWGNIELGFGILGAVRTSFPLRLSSIIKLTIPKPEPSSLSHILGLLQTRPRQHHLQNPLHLRPPKQLPPRLKWRCQLLRPELPPRFQKIQVIPQPHEQQSAIQHDPHAQLCPLANLGWLAQEQIFTRADPRAEEQQWCAQQ